jgi:hypothetical protein
MATGMQKTEALLIIYIAKNGGQQDFQGKKDEEFAEKREFVRADYSSGPLKAGATQQQARSKIIPLKQLFYLQEMAHFEYHDYPTHPHLPPFLRYPWFPGAEPGSIHTTYVWDRFAQGNLQRMVAKHLNERWGEVRNNRPDKFRLCSCEDILNYSGDEGCHPFTVLWDHWHLDLKRIVCGDKSKRPGDTLSS